ncbi:hypothetical protein K505DRAFT_324321 [Melanomma pulvis-pyrius CBS 109.77]|uniref:Uncharacterized protein n=1 Tax=Melanomma pulvis-pyrius CBS 109.77 TaxID=1314802 RepID=A0A6A6XF50_9PLEO|nr:hypothetical protein K505DRAFT_324321 [Melanomma pulvis-pyrius CBS 109.77]
MKYASERKQRWKRKCETRTQTDGRRKREKKKVRKQSKQSKLTQTKTIPKLTVPNSAHLSWSLSPFQSHISVQEVRSLNPTTSARPTYSSLPASLPPCLPPSLAPATQQNPFERFASFSREPPASETAISPLLRGGRWMRHGR